tara:strand:+ start:1265 stop:1474 length:210 start_codon:yes stop_codon:yes gene_type:complete
MKQNILALMSATTIGGDITMSWLKSRLKERTTLDGVVLVASGVAMIMVPVNLIAYAMIAYGAWTIWKSE